MKNKRILQSVFIVSLSNFLMLSCSSSQVYAPITTNNHKLSGASTVRIVRSGDTLYSIAWQIGQDYRDLAKWNGISKPYTIFKGQRLRLTPHSYAQNKTVKKATVNKKTYKKQKITENTSNLSQNNVQLSWQWPIKVKKIEKGFVSTGSVLVGTAGELVRSSEAGKVVYAGNGLKGYGNLIIVKHNEEFLTAYGYNRRLLVKEGNMIKKAQAIAEIGIDNKKRHVLFFELRRHGKAVSATKYLPK